LANTAGHQHGPWTEAACGTRCRRAHLTLTPAQTAIATTGKLYSYADPARLIDDRAQLQDELQEARAEADHAKSDQVRMARDAATMFDELRALANRHAEVHADQARLQAELESARAELEHAQRSWWRRLVGR
jgi:hypothetical protein